MTHTPDEITATLRRVIQTVGERLAAEDQQPIDAETIRELRMLVELLDERERSPRRDTTII